MTWLFILAALAVVVLVVLPTMGGAVAPAIPVAQVIPGTTTVVGVSSLPPAPTQPLPTPTASQPAPSSPLYRYSGVLASYQGATS